MSQELNLNVDQGANLEIRFTVLDENDDTVDLSSYTIESQVRKNYDAANTWSFTTESDNEGNLSLKMTSEESANVPPGRYNYDVEIVSPSNTTTRILEGLITFQPNMTR